MVLSPRNNGNGNGMTILSVTRRDSFGMERWYVEGESDAYALRELTGSKSVRKGDIPLLRHLGIGIRCAHCGVRMETLSDCSNNGAGS